MKQEIDAMWNDDPINISAETNLIWSIANKLRGPYRSDKYKDVIIPMTIIRRLECALEDTKDKVIAKAESGPDIAPDMLCRESRVQFYNTSRYTLKRLLDDPDNLRVNFLSYIDGFSLNVIDIIKGS